MDARMVMVRMLSGRGFWIALTVACGATYSAWRARTRRAELRRMMRVRARIAPPQQPQTVGVVLVRSQLEAILGVDLPHLTPNDRIGELLNWSESRALVEQLEQRFDEALPDIRTVRACSLEELGRQLGERRTPRSH